MEMTKPIYDTEQLKQREVRSLGIKTNNTQVIKTYEHGKEWAYSVLLHGHEVVTYYPKGRNMDGFPEILLDSCGWETVTTKDRINAALSAFDFPFRVYQEKFQWYVYRWSTNSKERWEFNCPVRIKKGVTSTGVTVYKVD